MAAYGPNDTEAWSKGEFITEVAHYFDTDYSHEWYVLHKKQIDVWWNKFADSPKKFEVWMKGRTLDKPKENTDV